MPKWISVKNKPVPKNVPFLGYVKLDFWIPKSGKDKREKSIQVCVWDGNSFKEACNCSGYERAQEYIEITHWMPLPKPPQNATDE